jgi:hypothetical protein
MPVHQDSFPPHVPPEEEACLRIISDYQRGHLTLQEAAPRLRDALRSLRGGINLTMPPSVRRLFAEVARLDGRSFPLQDPDPNRHAKRSPEMLRDLAGEAWRAVSQHPRANEALSISLHFAAATETTARAIVEWLERHGQQHVELESPIEADADDWIIRAATPRIRWSREDADSWAKIVSAAPLAGEASFMGWGV